MLKIIDDYDLKGLEKFGFEENTLLRTENEKYFILTQLTKNCLYYLDIFFIVNTTSRKLRFETSTYGIQDYEVEDFANLLFDLIQAGIVEKVEE